MLKLNISTKNLYDPIVKIYDELFNGETQFNLLITLEHDTNISLLSDFLSLLEDGKNDFNATIDIEVIDNAQILK